MLLHLMHALSPQLSAVLACIYINHGLSEHSDNWGKFCRNISNRYAIDFIELKIQEAPPAGVSIEAWAREMRYRLISDEMADGDILMTAHHRDDQVETVLLHLLRGSGPRGLSGMRTIRRFGRGWHARPILDCNRDELLHYATNNKLDYISDESNQDARYDRNFLRKNILPGLRKRWPNLNKTLARAADNQLFAVKILDALGAEDLKAAQGENNRVIDLDKFEKLDEQRQINLIIYWLRILDLPAPGVAHIDEIIKNIILSDYSKTPCTNWPGAEIRRYRRMMYALKPLSPHNPGARYSWDINRPLTLSYGIIEAAKGTGNGLAAKLCSAGDISIRYRQGGEKIRLAERRHSITVKDLFQKYGVIPWYRDRIPLIYIDGNLAAIPDICIDGRFAAKKDETSWSIIWKHPDPIIQYDK